jgi:uncharacterized membrane protein
MAPRSRRTIIVAVLGLIGLGIAIYLTIVHYTGAEPICGISHGCHTVQTSKYAELAGLPVAVLGLAGYAALLLALPIRGENGRLIRVAITAIGFLFSAYLTYLELFVINAICQWCVASAILMTALLIATAYDFLAPESDRYSSLAESPVSSATTPAAGRKRAPASTKR